MREIGVCIFSLYHVNQLVKLEIKKNAYIYSQRFLESILETVINFSETEILDLKLYFWKYHTAIRNK